MRVLGSRGSGSWVSGLGSRDKWFWVTRSTGYYESSLGYYTILYYTIPFHIIPCHTIPYPNIMYLYYTLLEGLSLSRLSLLSPIHS